MHINDEMMKTNCLIIIKIINAIFFFLRVKNNNKFILGVLNKILGSNKGFLKSKPRSRLAH
jgi:hypothetical protein